MSFASFLDREAEIANEISRRYYAAREEKLWENVERLLGRRPANAEIMKHGRRVIYPDGTVEWYWINTLILKESRLFELENSGNQYWRSYE